MKNLVVVSLSILVIWFLFIREPQINHGPGVMAPDEPLQIKVAGDSFSYKNYTITELASFDIRARVLSRKHYRTGRESELSPVDLALGWGQMSDESVLQHISISQSGRWYRWRAKSLPIPRRNIERQSANMHLIPADDSVKAVMKSAKRGDIVEIRGSLVKVTATDGWWWKSSLTRNDTGSRACEVVFVEDIYIESP